MSSAPRRPACSIPRIIRPIELGNGRLPISYAQHQNYSTDYSTSRFPVKDLWPAAKKEEIKKPDMSAYEDDDIFAPEIDFSTGELTKSPKEARPELSRPPMRLIPRTGRTIRVGKTVDVARAFTLLQNSVNANRVKSDSFQQKYHERRGLKRKRLERERWQKKFKTGFKSCVRRVKQLTKQGW